MFVREVKLAREAVAVNPAKLGKAAAADRANTTTIQSALLQQIKDKDDLPTLLPLPKLRKQSEWPKFYDIVKSYLCKDCYSLGLLTDIDHIASGGPYNNAIASAAFDDLFVNKI